MRQRLWFRLWNDQCGNVLLLVALMMVVLLLFTALSVDVGYLYWRRAQVSAQADAAALAGALALRDGANDGQVVQAVNGILQANGFPYEVSPGPVGEPNRVDINREEMEVHVELVQPEGWLFARVLPLVGGDAEDVDVAGKARARLSQTSISEGYGPGIVSFKDNGALDLSGNVEIGGPGTVLVHSNGGLVVNGSAVEASGNLAASAQNSLRGNPSQVLDELFGDNQTIGVRMEPPDLSQMIANADHTHSGNVRINNRTEEWEGVVFIDGDLDVGGNGRIEGGAIIIVSGDVKFTGNSTSSHGHIYAFGDLSVRGNPDTFAGGLYAQGDLDISGNSGVFIYQEDPRVSEWFSQANIRLVR